jgi:drug/metabolite transporter (DMT)-like permease
MKKQILLVRISYWAAALADFSIAILVLIPERMGLTEIEYPMGLVSAIAFSWGVLLLIADRKPLERRWILIPTILVVTLLTIVRTIFGINETIEFSIGLFLFGVVLIVLMAYSYYCANKLVSTKKQD